MNVTQLSTTLLLFLCVSAPVLTADEKPPADLSSAIDHYISLKRAAAGVTPAERSSDAEFVRRVYLDLTGRIPQVSEARSFLTKTRGATPRRNAELRALLVDDLLSRPSAATYFSEKWTRVLLGPRPMRQVNDVPFRNWLRIQFQQNTAYDKTVRQMLQAQGSMYGNAPALFYAMQRNEPEKIAANTSRSLLGVQIQCAQCHDHPFDHWKQEDFWGFAALFARLNPASTRQLVAYTVKENPTGELKHPQTQAIVPPVFLGGEPLEAGSASRIVAAAGWLTAGDNPYFAKATVNRVWAMLMRSGLVEPVDDLGTHNPASHPQLLKAMTAFFVASNFNIRELLRGIVLSETYQLSSRSQDEHADVGEQLYAWMNPRQLSAAELYDSIALAAYKPTGNVTRRFPLNSDPRNKFINRFATPDEPGATYNGGVLQALSMMNGEVTGSVADAGSSRMIAALNGPFFTDKQRIEVLFLATLSRYPVDNEQKRMLKHLHAAGANNRQQALGDMFWALLNSAEFGLNH